MRIAVTNPLFAWDCLEDGPTLKTIRQLLDVIPDHALLESLRTARGKGRDDYPIRLLWGVLVLGIALRHPTIEHCLAELRRNAAGDAYTAYEVFRAPSLSGIQPVPQEETIPG